MIQGVLRRPGEAPHAIAGASWGVPDGRATAPVPVGARTPRVVSLRPAPSHASGWGVAEPVCVCVCVSVSMCLRLCL